MKAHPKVFLDTNILVYAYDERDASRHLRAVSILGDELSAGQAVISSQVIGEFCNVMMLKRGLMKAANLRIILDEVLGKLLAHVPSIGFYDRALALQDRYSLSFYDAQIVQAALDLECDALYSEDLQDGQSFGRLKIVNPLKGSL